MEDRRSGKRRGREGLGDLAAWERANGEDNSEAIARLRRNLRRVRREELTSRQAEMLHLYYDLGRSMPRIAQELGVNKSTVSRTLARARARLKRYLRYTL